LGANSIKQEGNENVSLLFFKNDLNIVSLFRQEKNNPR